jgi:hypothetical protein
MDRFGLVQCRRRRPNSCPGRRGRAAAAALRMMESAEICSCGPILPPQDQARESEPSIHESKGIDCNARSYRFGIDCVGAGRSRWKRRFSGTTAIPFHAIATIFAECADLWHIRSYHYSYCVTRRRLHIVFFVRFLLIESVVHSSPEGCIRSTRRLRRVLLHCGTRAFV